MSNAAIIKSAIQGYRISPQQERLWLLTRDHERTPYRAQCALRIEGAIDAIVAQRMVRQLVERHEILRTTFQCLPGMILPVQVINNGDLFDWEEHDLTGLSKNEQQATVETLRHGAWTRPLDFSCGPLLKLTLLKLGQASYLLVVTLPALCADSATLRNVAREIARACAMGGDDRSAADACTQYADFAEWQHSLLDADGDPGRTYWRKQALSHSSSVFHARLPFEWSTTESLAFSPLSRSINISAALPVRINELAETTETSVSAVFSACWQALLDRLTDQPNIRIGAACDNRIYPEFEQALGPFSKFLPVYCGVERELSFRVTLAKFHAALSATRKWQEYFAWDGINPSVTHALNRPLFHFCYEFDEQPVPYVADGTPIGIEWSRAYTDGFKVMLGVVRKGGLFEAALHYDASIYPSGSITTLADQYETLLSDAVCRPDGAVMRLRMLSDVERQKLLYGFNPTQGCSRQDTRCLHELIEAQVIRTPNATAVVCGDQSLTYVELNRQANQLARYLLSRGVGPDVLVAISVERSIEMVVGLLGILKAGGAYVPIDPGYPKDRIRVMLEDSRVPLLLTQERLATNLPAANVDILCLDRDWPLVAEYAATAPNTCATSANLAYVIFTSGSTGRPKGVMVSHDNVIQSTRARSAYYQEPIRSFLLFSSFAFDSSVAGLFWTLSAGGCLCIPDEGVQKDPTALLDLISQQKVSHLLSLPLFYAVLLQQITPAQAESLCTVIVAGEACSRDVVAQHYGKLSQALLFNEYGPTEGTVWSSVYQAGAPDRELTVSIGSPIGHTQIYVLDTSLEPVPIGISGELYIGGAGLARGYLNRPDLTAERFIPNSFSDQPGERLYQTGDLARYRVDGNLEYLGRIDHQVKVRGFRIELGEIEARLIEHPQVKEAVVLAREDTPGEKQLVGYVVGKEEDVVPAIDELRAYLRRLLPEYMVPGAFVVLDALPLTPNGKVDRKGLSAPDVSAQLAHQYVAPRNPTEEALACIWADVLGVERVGVHDDFFVLGGHSILAVELLFKMQEICKIDLSLQTLFERPTVSAQADAIEQVVSSTVPSRGMEINLETEVTLDSTITPVATRLERNISPRAIFLTGATGFLGAFLLHELLERTQAKVYCLVRASTISEASARLRQNLVRYELWDPDQSSRILPVCGDLSLPRLGVSKVKFQELSLQIDVIYHSGAGVYFTQSYMSLKPANVGGTEEVLRLACIGRTKPVHYVSTLSVFGDEADPGPTGIAEDDVPDPDSGLRGGYAQSKWVAERIVRVANARGLPVTIYRSTAITGDSYTGIWNTSDFLCRMIKAFIELGKAPDFDYVLDMVPVDYVSKAIVSLSTQDRFWGRTFHLNNPSPLSLKELIKWANTWGYCVEPVPFAQWLNAVRDVAKRFPDHILFPLLPLFDEEIPDSESRAEASRQRYDCRKTLKTLSGSGVTCPDTGADLLQTYFSYFVRSGFIPAPQLVAPPSPY